MNTIIRKISTALGSAALVGSSVAFAAAASWPDPFTSNAAIVVGANAAPSDNIAAADIASNLDAASAGDNGDVRIDGESYKLEKTSTLFHLGDNITQVVSSTVDDDDLPTMLKDGVYIDDDNDEFDYTQKFTIASTLQLEMFSDNDYADKDPTLGFYIATGEGVIDYTLDFSEEPLLGDILNTDLPMMGREYYVLGFDLQTDGFYKLTLLDSATETLLTEGETTTINVDGTSYTVSIDFVSDTETKLTVNGETTNTLAEGETYKLSDETYVGVKDILYSSKDTGVSKVEFSLGNGKLILDGDGATDVELNDDTINDLTVTITNTTTALSSILIDWDAEDEIFVTEDSVATMPGFEAVSLSYTGMDFLEEEEIKIDVSDDYVMLDDFPIKDSEIDLPLLYGTGGAWTGLGEDSTSVLRTTNATSMTFDDDTDEHFIVSWSDGNDAESYLVKATNFITESTTNKTSFQYMVNGVWKDASTKRETGSEFSLGNADIGVGAIDKAGKNVVVTANNSNTNFNTLYSKGGLKVYLPYEDTHENASALGEGAINFSVNQAGHNATSWYLIMYEEDKDENKGSGDWINATASWNSESTQEPTVSAVGTSNTDASSTEIGDTDVYRDFTYSALATEILWDKSTSAQKTLKLMYHGGESSANVYITASDAVSSGGGETGVMTVTDTQKSTVSGKNLVVVGGSAINSVAADLLGGPYREAEFTAATGVSAGGFLIQSFSHSGATALLVAGYHAEDTQKATTYLLNNDVTTDVGTKYMGTSATEATMTVV